MIACFGRTKENLMKDEENFFMRNGRMLLEESITLFDGKINPIRQFSATELKSATENFDRKYDVQADGHYTLYKGFFQGRAVLVKKYNTSMYERSIARDIVIASRTSVHKNVLKLIGCCLEIELPSLVFESIDCDGTLADRLDRPNIDELQPLPWKDRLKIAVDISNLIAYLHTAFPRPFIYRNLKPWNTLLDKDSGVVKFLDFSLCVSLPEGESYIEDNPAGTFGYIAPEVFEGRFNEKADVYSFGVTLFFLISGKRPQEFLYDNDFIFVSKCVENDELCDKIPDPNRSEEESWPGNGDGDDYLWSLGSFVRKCVENDELFDKILDPKLSEEESWPGKNMQFKTFLMIAVQCIRQRADDRPGITDVARQLKEMWRGLVCGS